jgi:hypothetical protein
MIGSHWLDEKAAKIGNTPLNLIEKQTDPQPARPLQMPHLVD